jgi:hypothetical protein
MDHLLAPDGTAPIDVPYLCKEEYDGGDFMTYPQRKNWTDDELDGSNSFGGRSPEEVESFFQTWLYFGTLLSIFGPIGRPIATADFLRLNGRGEKLITTAKFPDFIQAWMNREGMRSDVDTKTLAPKFKSRLLRTEEKDMRGKIVEQILRRVHYFATKFCSTEGRENEVAAGRQPSFWPISPKVGMAILAIGDPLFHVATEIYGYARYATPDWGSSPFLNERLKAAGWCVRDVPTFNGAIDCDYYFGSVTSPRANLDHSECTRIVCKAKNVNVAEYVTKHVPGCTDSSQPFIPAPDNVADIVREGGIPILKWKDGILSCYPYDPKIMTRYVV